jgi:hypothetical protein
MAYYLYNGWDENGDGSLGDAAYPEFYVGHRPTAASGEDWTMELHIYVNDGTYYLHKNLQSAPTIRLSNGDNQGFHHRLMDGGGWNVAATTRPYTVGWNHIEVRKVGLSLVIVDLSDDFVLLDTSYASDAAVTLASIGSSGNSSFKAFKWTNHTTGQVVEIDINERSNTGFVFDKSGTEIGTLRNYSSTNSQWVEYAIDPLSWAKRVKRAPLNVPSELNGFTALLTEVNLPAEVFTLAKSDGSDLRICLNKDGTEILPIEVVEFDTVNSKAVIWTRLPVMNSLSSFWIFYGNASAEAYAVDATNGRNAVWADHAMSVHGNSFTDSSDGSTLTDQFGNVTTVSGQIGEALNFPIESNLDTNKNFNLGTGSFTWKGWIKAPAGGAANLRVIFGNNPNAGGFNSNWMVMLQGGYFRLYTVGGDAVSTPDGGTNLLDGLWYHVVAVRDGSVHTVYVDGVVDGTVTAAPIDVSDTITEGFSKEDRGDWSGFTGDLNESYLMKSALSADYIATEYNNQSAPSTFWSSDLPESTALGDIEPVHWQKKFKVTGQAPPSDLNDGFTALITHENLPSGFWDYVEPSETYLVLDGVNDYVDAASVPPVTSSNVRIEFSIKNFVNVGNNQIFFDWGTYLNGLYFHYTGSRLNLYYDAKEFRILDAAWDDTFSGDFVFKIVVDDLAGTVAVTVNDTTYGTTYTAGSFNFSGSGLRLGTQSHSAVSTTTKYDLEYFRAYSDDTLILDYDPSISNDTTLVCRVNPANNGTLVNFNPASLPLVFDGTSDITGFSFVATGDFSITIPPLEVSSASTMILMGNNLSTSCFIALINETTLRVQITGGARVNLPYIYVAGQTIPEITVSRTGTVLTASIQGEGTLSNPNAVGDMVLSAYGSYSGGALKYSGTMSGVVTLVGDAAGTITHDFDASTGSLLLDTTGEKHGTLNGMVFPTPPEPNYFTTANGGGDLRACLNEDGTGRLPLELVDLDTQARTAVIWSRFPTYSAALRDIWFFVGKEGEVQPIESDEFGRNGVWVDYEVVNHGRDYTNSTGKTGDLVPDGTAPTSAPIIHGGGFSFDSTNFLQTTIPTAIVDPAVVTLQSWTRQRVSGTAESTQNMAGVSAGSTAGNVDLTLVPRESSTGSGWVGYVEPNGVPTATQGTTYAGINAQGIPAYCAVSFDYNSGEVRSYLKNSLVDIENNLAPRNNSTAYSLTKFAYGGRYDGSPAGLAGIVTEARLKLSALTVDEARTEYNNQSNPRDFWATGDLLDTTTVSGPVLINILVLVSEQGNQASSLNLSSGSLVGNVIGEQFNNTSVLSVTQLEAQDILTLLSEQLNNSLVVSSALITFVNSTASQQLADATTISVENTPLVIGFITEQFNQLTTVDVSTASFVNSESAEQLSNTLSLLVSDNTGLNTSIGEQLNEAVRTQISAIGVIDTRIAEQLNNISTIEIDSAGLVLVNLVNSEQFNNSVAISVGQAPLISSIIGQQVSEVVALDVTQTAMASISLALSQQLNGSSSVDITTDLLAYTLSAEQLTEAETFDVSQSIINTSVIAEQLNNSTLINIINIVLPDATFRIDGHLTSTTIINGLIQTNIRIDGTRN